MKRNHDLQKWEPFEHDMNHANNLSPYPSQEIDQMFGQMMKDLEKWFQPKQWEGFFQKLNQEMNQQVQLHEHEKTYYIKVQLDGIEQPDDIQVQLHNNLLYLKRIAQHEVKENTDYGSIWKTSYHHFERTIPLEKPIEWSGREIQAQKGIWVLKLPQK